MYLINRRLGDGTHVVQTYIYVVNAHDFSVKGEEFGIYSKIFFLTSHLSEKKLILVSYLYIKYTAKFRFTFLAIN